jgi:HAD superfamily hydrolase (TIGR01509 family)
VSAETELVIFDCDGVLVDSERLVIDVDIRLCHEFGYEITRQEIIDRFLGRRAGLLWEELEAQIGRTLTPEEHAYITQTIWDVFDDQLIPVPGVTDAIDALNHKLCVASSSTPNALRHKLEHCGLLSRFDPHIFSGDQVEHGKPAPDLFLFAADQVGIPAERCVVVEDSIHGANAARAAGMHVFAYVTGMVAEERLDGPATTLFSDMDQLPGLISAHVG